LEPTGPEERTTRLLRFILPLTDLPRGEDPPDDDIEHARKLRLVLAPAEDAGRFGG
jgi:hypothetical protein